MGWSYKHIALFGPSQQHIAVAVADRHAAISPTVNGFTLVVDEEMESLEEYRISALATSLSKRLDCPALIVSVFDDDIFCYQLIEEGVVIDHYNSEPDYFDFATKHVPPRGPLGGDAERLCTTLKRIGAREQIDRILHRQDVGLQAPDRHRELAEALGIPAFSVGFDYRALQSGELPRGLNEFDVIFTTIELG